MTLEEIVFTTLCLLFAVVYIFSLWAGARDVERAHDLARKIREDILLGKF